MALCSLPKSERLCSLTVIGQLFASGRSGFVYPFRYVMLPRRAACGVEPGAQSAAVAPGPAAGTEATVRVLFSVPKKYLKRANKRNLVKRRMREAYRLNKSELVETLRAAGEGMDVALVYNTRQVEDYKTIENGVRKIISTIPKRM